MSQVSKIRRVRVHGQVFVGAIEDVDTWSSDPVVVSNWLTDGWRYRFNQHRSKRCLWSAPDFFDQVGNDLGRVLIPLGHQVTDITDKQAREQYSFLSALPSWIIASAGRLEEKEWFGATKRRTANAQAGRPRGDMPRFRSRGKSSQAFTCWFGGGTNAKFQRTGKRSGVVTITGQNPAGKRGPADYLRWRVVFHIRVSEPIRTYTSVQVNLTAGTVTFVNPPAARPRPSTGAVVGLDFGVTRTIATSDGVFLDQPNTAALEQVRKRAQRRMAKSRKVALAEHRPFYLSNGYQAKKARAAAVSAKIARIRDDWQHKVTAKLVREYDIIGVENLQLRNMTRKAHLKNVAQKRGLNRGLHNAALGELRSKLEYKAALNGSTIIAVRAAYTSQRCNPCGHISRENRESQAVFSCVSCGHTANADINAAMNICDDALVIAGIAEQPERRRGQRLTGSPHKTKPETFAGKAQAKNRKPPLTAPGR